MRNLAGQEGVYLQACLPRGSAANCKLGQRQAPFARIRWRLIHALRAIKRDGLIHAEPSPGLDHVVHLTQHVLEQHGLLAETLHAMQLLFIEILRNTAAQRAQQPPAMSVSQVSIQWPLLREDMSTTALKSLHTLSLHPAA